MADLDAFGPFFSVEVGAPSGASEFGAPSGASWQRMDALVSDPAVLAARVQRVRSALAQRAGQPADLLDIRVAASVAHLGLIARLLAPQIGAAAIGRRLSWSLEGLWWKDELGGPYPLAAAQGGPYPPAGAPAYEAITLALLNHYPVSARVLWGNVGSAANSAAQMISRARPDLADDACQAADTILADPRVDGGALRSQPGYRRRSCCLIYRIGSSRDEYCGDCVLRR